MDPARQRAGGETDGSLGDVRGVLPPGCASACLLMIEKRGAPKAVLLGIRDYVRLAAPEPEVLRAIG